MLSPPIPIGGISPPEGTVIEAAQSLCVSFAGEALRNHSLRSYYWAAAHAATWGIQHDAELLYVAAALHDLALTPYFDNHSLAFEEAGAYLARVFASGAGWTTNRQDRLAKVIVLHMRDAVAVEMDAESYLLQVGVSADVSGKDLEAFAVDFRAEVLHHFPRAGFGEEFVQLIRDQARRKPESAAAELLHGGVVMRILANPLDRMVGDSARQRAPHASAQ